MYFNVIPKIYYDSEGTKNPKIVTELIKNEIKNKNEKN